MPKRILTYLTNHILQSPLVLWVVVTLLFRLFRLVLGNPLVAYIDLTLPEQYSSTWAISFKADWALLPPSSI